MCGIVGAIAKSNVVPLLLDCLKRLEYRGYDSAGIAVLEPQGGLKRLRAVGKIDVLAQALQKKPLYGNTGITHTRWATHGAPTEANAHPHFSGNSIAVVHNGIIENYQELRTQLQSKGYQFSSETDTEVIAHSIHKHYLAKADFLFAVHNTVQELVGMYALAIINDSEPNRIIAVRSGSPLVIGLGTNTGECFLASDCMALSKITQDFIYLEEGDIADLSPAGVTIYNSKLQPVTRQIHVLASANDAADRGHYQHHMLKEIFEQPRAIANTLEHYPETTSLASKTLSVAKCIQFVACGTSYHAGLLGKYWLEELVNIPCQVDVASEFRYKKHPVEPNTLLIAISQSGETADTLAVVRQAKTMGYLGCLAICNVEESSLVRESDVKFLTRAGIEIGVASTKAFTTQLAAILLLTLTLGNQEAHLMQQLKLLPNLIEEALLLNNQIKVLAEEFVAAQHALFLGRGAYCPIAMEGALKMKEISYIHAEAYAAGELKHGPLALIDKNLPVIVLAPNNNLFPKLQSNIQEVEARGGKMVIVTDNVAAFASKPNISIIPMPKMPEEIAPVVYTIPLQLLAYHVALLKGSDIDQPRNLAKSVTVE